MHARKNNKVQGRGRPAGRIKQPLALRVAPETMKTIETEVARLGWSQTRFVEKAVAFAANHRDFGAVEVGA